jgi:hypothetical protein
MASLLKVDSLTGVTTAGSISVTGEGNSTTTNLQQGLAKAWASYEMYSSDTIRGSFNVSSKADNGTGDSTIAWTNSMQNGYAVGSMSSENLFVCAQQPRGNAYNSVLTTSSGRVFTISDGGSPLDSNVNLITVHGDLA